MNYKENFGDLNMAPHSAVARQPRTPRSRVAPTIRRGPTMYIVLVS